MWWRAVVELGDIEWLHQGFHDERYLWPPDYVAEREAATPASGGKAVTHRCQVLAATDGSGPLFRCASKVRCLGLSFGAVVLHIGC